MSDQELQQDEADVAAPAAEEEKTYQERADDLRTQLRRAPGDWYVVHTYAGYEKRVKVNLETRIQTQEMDESIYEIDVPIEEAVEIKNAQRKVVSRVRIPGYVVVRMEMTDESWTVVRHTPGVTGFVGNAHDPQPLSTDEVFNMLVEHRLGKPDAQNTADPRSLTARRATVETAPEQVSVEFEVGESVTVTDGPFATLPASVSEYSPRLPPAGGSGLDL